MANADQGAEARQMPEMWWCVQSGRQDGPMSLDARFGAGRSHAGGFSLCFPQRYPTALGEAVLSRKGPSLLGFLKRHP